MSKRLYIGVDLQKGFLTDKIIASGYIEKIEKFLATLSRDEVVLSKFINHPDSAFIRVLEWNRMQTDDPDTQLFGNLEIAGYDVVEKTGYTAWVPTVIEKAHARAVEEIVIFGLDTDACVLKTALDVFDAGLCPLVLKDLSASSGGQTRHNIGIDLLNITIDQKHVLMSDQLNI